MRIPNGILTAEDYQKLASAVFYSRGFYKTASKPVQLFRREFLEAMPYLGVQYLRSLIAAHKTVQQGIRKTPGALINTGLKGVKKPQGAAIADAVNNSRISRRNFLRNAATLGSAAADNANAIAFFADKARQASKAVPVKALLEVIPSNG